MSDAPPKVLLDTDLGGDVDDLGAVEVLHALADAGACEVLGVLSDTAQRHAVNCIDAVGLWRGRRVPIGRPGWALEEHDNHATRVAEAFPDALDGRDAPEAAALALELLAGVPDGSVVVATIGKLWHQLDLLERDAALYAAKVRRVVCMGGYTPLTPAGLREPGGAETNFRGPDGPPHRGSGVARAFVERCPAPVVFCGFEAGLEANGYGTGRGVAGLPAGHPVRIGCEAFFAEPIPWAPGRGGRGIESWSIWDQITVLHAVRGASTGADPLGGSGFEEVGGSVNVLGDGGGNHWRAARAGDPEHRYLRPVAEPARIAAELVEPLMLTRPERG